MRTRSLLPDYVWQSAENLQQTATRILAAWNGIQHDSSASESQSIDGGTDNDSDSDDETDIAHPEYCTDPGSFQDHM